MRRFYYWSINMLIQDPCLFALVIVIVPPLYNHECAATVTVFTILK